MDPSPPLNSSEISPRQPVEDSNSSSKSKQLQEIITKSGKHLRQEGQLKDEKQEKIEKTFNRTKEFITRKNKKFEIQPLKEKKLVTKGKQDKIERLQHLKLLKFEETSNLKTEEIDLKNDNSLKDGPFIFEKTNEIFKDPKLTLKENQDVVKFPKESANPRTLNLYKNSEFKSFDQTYDDLLEKFNNQMLDKTEKKQNKQNILVLFKTTELLTKDIIEKKGYIKQQITNFLYQSEKLYEFSKIFSFFSFSTLKKLIHDMALKIDEITFNELTQEKKLFPKILKKMTAIREPLEEAKLQEKLEKIDKISNERKSHQYALLFKKMGPFQTYKYIKSQISKAAHGEAKISFSYLIEAIRESYPKAVQAYFAEDDSSIDLKGINVILSYLIKKEKIKEGQISTCKDLNEFEVKFNVFKENEQQSIHFIFRRGYHMIPLHVKKIEEGQKFQVVITDSVADFNGNSKFYKSIEKKIKELVGDSNFKIFLSATKRQRDKNTCPIYAIRDCVEGSKSQNLDSWIRLIQSEVGEENKEFKAKNYSFNQLPLDLWKGMQSYKEINKYRQSLLKDKKFEDLERLNKSLEKHKFIFEVKEGFKIQNNYAYDRTNKYTYLILAEGLAQQLKFYKRFDL